MVPTNFSERSEKKPRGRPFAKGNLNGKPRDSILDASGRESSIGRGNVALLPEKHGTELKNKEINKNDNVIRRKKESLETLKPVCEELKEQETGEETGFTLVDSLTFKNGPNILTITLKKKRNRMYRLQIFLNDIQEVRPLTYNGSATATTFWNLLKGSLKK